MFIVYIIGGISIILGFFFFFRVIILGVWLEKLQLMSEKYYLNLTLLGGQSIIF